MARQALVSIFTAFMGLGSVLVEAQEREQVKAWLLEAAAGDDVLVRLSDGEQVEGTLAETEETRFGVWVEPDAATKERLGNVRSVKRWIDYTDVSDLVLGGLPVGPSGGSLSFRLRFGDEARVRTSSGTLKGKVTDFDGTILRLEGHTFDLAEGDVQRIEVQQRDSLTNGAIIGLAAGVGFVGFACTQGCSGGIAAAGALFYGAAGAGIGALIDSLHRGYTTVYVGSESELELSVVPVLRPRTKGVAVTFSF